MGFIVTLRERMQLVQMNEIRKKKRKGLNLIELLR